jgi:alkaline phosphatase D
MAVLDVWSGGLTATSAVVKARLTESAASLRVSTSADLSSPTSVAGTVTGGIATFTLTLQPGTQYHYAVEAGGTVATALAGKLRTPAVGPMSFSVAVGCCAQGVETPGATGTSNHAVFDKVRLRDPLMTIHLGDAFYRDIGTNSPDLFRTAYNDLLANSRQAALYRAAPIELVWDDHDYSSNDSGSGSPAKPAAALVYRERVPSGPLPDPTAIYRTRVYGRVRFIYTDTRSERTSENVYSATQEAWLINLLTTSTEPVICWVSSIPWISPDANGGDDWGSYNTQRYRIANAIVLAGRSSRIFMLSGDMHAVAIDDGANNTWGGFPVYQFGSFDSAGSSKGGPYSKGAPSQGGNRYGIVTVTDTGQQITVNGVGYNGDTALMSHSFTVQAPFTPPVGTSSGVLLQEDFTGPNGATWSGANWQQPQPPQSAVGTTYTIEGNAGRISLPGGSGGASRGTRIPARKNVTIQAVLSPLHAQGAIRFLGRERANEDPAYDRLGVALQVTRFFDEVQLVDFNSGQFFPSQPPPSLRFPVPTLGASQRLLVELALFEETGEVRAWTPETGRPAVAQITAPVSNVVGEVAVGAINGGLATFGIDSITVTEGALTAVDQPKDVYVMWGGELVLTRDRYMLGGELEGVAPPPPTPRLAVSRGSVLAVPVAADGFSLRLTKAVPENTGNPIPLEDLEVFEGDFINTLGGREEEGLLIRGRVIDRAGGFLLKRSVVAGAASIPATDYYLADATHASGDMRLEYCTLRATAPNIKTEGGRGDLHLFRCEVGDVVDGLGAIAGRQLTVEGTWVGDLAYFYGITYQPNGQTHCDCIQVHSPTSLLTVIGSTLAARFGTKGMSYPGDGIWPATGTNTGGPTPQGRTNPDLAALMYGSGTAGAAFQHVLEDNWLEDGLVTVNMLGLTNGSFARMWRNRFNKASNTWRVGAGSTVDGGVGTGNQNVRYSGALLVPTS